MSEGYEVDYVCILVFFVPPSGFAVSFVTPRFLREDYTEEVDIVFPVEPKFVGVLVYALSNNKPITVDLNADSIDISYVKSDGNLGWTKSSVFEFQDKSNGAETGDYLGHLC